MKFLLTLAFIGTALFSLAQNKGYVAVKTGLNLRDKPDAKAAVLVKIPYGTAINTTYPDSTISITTEGLTGSWVKTSYGGKTGYVINTYLLPEPPPKATVKTMKEYLAQIAAIAGPALVVKKGSMENVEEGGTEIRKQLYKNAAEHHAVAGYEWNNDTYFLPDFTMKQGFVLLRLIPEFKTVFAEGDAFPTKNATYKKGQSEYTVKVESEMISTEKWINRIKIEFEDGAVYTFEMFELGSQLVISFGGGV